MNDPNKTIEVNLSSLMSLKAELLRKQQEVKQVKTDIEQHRVKPISSATVNSKKIPKQISKKGESKVYEIEDSLELEKSRRALEAKAKYYERMSRSGGSLNSDDNCLVMFNRKKQETEIAATDERQSFNENGDAKKSKDVYKESYNKEDTYSDNEDDDEDEWAEYIDCLGRTRKCLRKDLDEAKRRDKELAKSMPERLDQSKANWMMDVKQDCAQIANNSDEEEEEFPIGPRPPGSVFSECLSTVSKLEEQRANWEIKEKENLTKEDVHYQDVFFDEARQHGVGYYAFSTDEEERRKQQRDLERAREATLDEQAKRVANRLQRERTIADRVFAAKNRVRAREGLPPMTKEEFDMERNKKSACQAEAERIKEEEEERKNQSKEEREKSDLLRAKERKGYIRPWDKSKLTTTNDDNETKTQDMDMDMDKDKDIEAEWQYKRERLPMSQEEWNEKQRAVRIPEFAPIPDVVQPKRNCFNAAPPTESAVTLANEKFSLYQSTQASKKFQRRNTSISDDEQRGCAIPPPPCLADAQAMPPPTKKLKTQVELERSIEAGLRFIRENTDKGKLTSKTSWSAKKDY